MSDNEKYALEHQVGDLIVFVSIAEVLDVIEPKTGEPVYKYAGLGWWPGGFTLPAGDFGITALDYRHTPLNELVQMVLKKMRLEKPTVAAAKDTDPPTAS